MVQAWILPQSENPVQAIKTGADSAVCGDCKLRGSTCYVRIYQAPNQIWKAWNRGSYHDWTRKIPANALDGRRVRFGAYGDPAAAPMRIWRKVLNQNILGWTGYTHQWRKPGMGRYKAFLMASVDNEQEAKTAWAKGWRTFRLRRNEDVPLTRQEIVCPASNEGGNSVNCINCLLCSGQKVKAKNIVIVMHGNGATSKKGIQ